MSQSRLGSLVETCSNVTIGYLVSLVLQLIVFPLYDIHVSLLANVQIGIIFTITAIARGYVVRRVFNWYHHAS